MPLKNETKACPAAGALSDPVYLHVGNKARVSIAMQYTSGAGSLVGDPGQAALQITPMAATPAGYAPFTSLGQENVRDEDIGDTLWEETQKVAHKSIEAFGGAVAAVESVWPAVAICCDVLEVRVREIGDIANPGSVEIRWMAQG